MFEGCSGRLFVTGHRVALRTNIAINCHPRPVHAGPGEALEVIFVARFGDGVEPVPERFWKTTGKEFLSRHWEVIVATDFSTVEV
jgi:hypothetical protein